MPQLLHLAVPGSVRRAAQNKCAGQAQAGSLHLPADFQCAPLRSESLSQPSIIPLGKHWPRSVDREARLCRADLRHMCLPGSRKPGKKRFQALARCQTRFTQTRGSQWQQVGLYFYVFVLRWRGLTHGHTARPQAACLFAGVAELLGKEPLGCRNSESCPPTSAASAHAESSASPTAALAVPTVSLCLVFSAAPSCMRRSACQHQLPQRKGIAASMPSWRCASRPFLSCRDPGSEGPAARGTHREVLLQALQQLGYYCISLQE